jgi:DNA invertase Pin-like site-specific DNA recombinase
MKCYSYVRFSSKIQARGRSYDRQLEAARKFANEKGWELDENLCMFDLGLSGFHALHKSKGELGVFLKTVEEGKIPIPSALIVENLDRLSRETIPAALTQFLNIINAGITIVTLMDKQIYDLESLSRDTSQLLISISVMSRGHEESLTKQIRRGDAWDKARHLARDGKKVKSRCVAWVNFNKDEEVFEKNDTHVETIRKIYQLYISGHGLYGICKILNENHTPTFHKTTKGWGSTTIRRLLTTRSVLGEMQFFKTSKIKNGERITVPDGEPIPNYYPAIIDEDTFYAAQHRQALRKCAFGKIGGMKNLFSKIVKCGYCGATMQYNIRGTQKTRYLNCRESLRKSCAVKLTLSFRYKDLEDAFLKFCDRLDIESVIFEDASEHNVKIKNLRKIFAILKKKHEESESKVQKYTAAIETGTYETISYFVNLINEEKEFQNNSLKSQKEISHELRSLENLHSNASKSLNNLQDLLSKLSRTDQEKHLDLRRKLQKSILELVEKVVIYPRGRNYLEMIAAQATMSSDEVKNLYSLKMNKHRTAEFHFRTGGKLVLEHDDETVGLKFAYQLNENMNLKDADVEYYKRLFKGEEDMFGLIFPAILLKPAPQIFTIEDKNIKLTNEPYDPKLNNSGTV